ncbi:peroxidase family protein [Roseomonas fluvialis]|uniref:peroxidase family protein n=1 Tax=Roseomonas fluvialis TaxID=1750527 RepID=UPI001FCC4515|nr:peroxidase family protein [Roseomonas fluvialis]
MTLASEALDGASPEEVEGLQAALAAAEEHRDAAEVAKVAATSAATGAGTSLVNLLKTYDVEMSGDSLVLPNVAPDEGLSAPYNSWFTLFGQFFDHGLDLVQKGGNGTVYIPLQPDDPLYRAPAGEDGVLGTEDDVHTNFMAVTRTNGPEAANLTTPWVDQNQTYTSHPSHQVFLREYEMVGGRPVATGRLLDGADGGLATWADVKAQARDFLGINLTDDFVTGVPLIKTDPYGKFIPSTDGFPQVVFLVQDPPGSGVYVEQTDSGTPDAPLNIAGAARIANAFLDDIAHDAAPVLLGGELQDDDDDVVGYAGGTFQGRNTSYDNELLDAHFVTGDGRGNENIGLTAVHHVFHSEHNRLVDQVKQVVLASEDLEFINAWLSVPVTELPAPDAELAWNGERLFQAARFTTEMQYQHLVFEEFARKVQPDIDVFMVQPNVELNPQIFAEFAHVVYRFGHSMLNETVDRVTEDGNSDASMTLFDAFLNPLAFNDLDGQAVNAEVGAGAIIRGMTGQVGNEIDEFVTDALRNNLLGLPLDLAAINIARAREAGMPTLNEARAQFQELAGGDTQLTPYTSWADFALNLKNPASIVNFIAAYGTHASIEAEETAAGKREAALKLVMGGVGAPADRVQFLNAQGDYAGGALGGLQNVDFWIGGLAEKKMAFGGMLGSTFSFVFELQMENLQNADRFYYLSRTQGMNLLTELENNSLAKIVQRNTDLGETMFALPADIFAVPDFTFYVDLAKQQAFGHQDPEHDDPVLQALSNKVERGVTENGDKYIRFNGLEHVVIAGTENDDSIVSGGGDDGVWGFDGNDTIEAGYGVDKIMGGDGDDIITNAGTDIGETDMLHGDDGNDVIHGGSGLSLIFGGKGQDAIILGPDGSEARSGTGNDFVIGREGSDVIFGNEGDDWVEAGANFDYIAGDNGDIFFNSPIIGHDVLNGGSGDTDYDADSGDDIMFGGEGIQKFIGMWGFDWSIYKGQLTPAVADMNIRVFTTLPEEVLRDRFSEVEAASGWDNDDVLRGDDRAYDVNIAVNGTLDPTPEGNFAFNELTQEGIDRIAGLNAIVTPDLLHEVQLFDPVTLETIEGAGGTIMGFAAGNILLGGGGSDTIEGRGGDDIIDGDAWLDVRINVMGTGADSLTILESVDSLADIQDRLLNGTINPGQLQIAREIRYANAAGDVDVAVFSGDFDEYAVTVNADGSVTVAHDGGAGVDGTDTLRNIELLEFNDRDLAPANGSFTLDDLTPTQTQILTVTLADPDGVQSSAITWEALTAPNTWTAVGTGATFTPGATEMGRVLRVSAQYTDSLGIVTNIAPIVTGVVGGYFSGSAAGQLTTMTASSDLAFGNAGHDTILGDAGDDTLNGGTGNDSLQGGAGADLLRGEIGNDTLDGGGEADRLEGGAGNDSLFGGDGMDQLLGDVGNDTLDGGIGADVLEGGTGNDVYVVDDVGDQVVEVSGGGSDLVRTTLATYTLGANVENLTYTGALDFTGYGNNLSNVITGGAANNVLYGAGGNDRMSGLGGHDSLFGEAGNDSLLGGEGDDTLDGGVGVDTLNGGAGNDYYVVDNVLDVVIDTAGNDTVETTLANFTLTGSLERLYYAGSGNFVGTGNGLANEIRGGDGNDTLSGGAGHDTLVGGDGNDEIDGGSGNDVLRGGVGNDTIVGGLGGDTIEGGEGDDILLGGAGADVFVFSAGFGNDVIEGYAFLPGETQDRIDIRSYGFTVEEFNLGVEIQITGDTSQTVITIGSDEILLAGVDVATVNQTDFIL